MIGDGALHLAREGDRGLMKLKLAEKDVRVKTIQDWGDYVRKPSFFPDAASLDLQIMTESWNPCDVGGRLLLLVDGQF